MNGVDDVNSPGPDEPLIPLDTPAEHLAAWAATNPELHDQIAAHPNAYPDLVAWIAEQRAVQAAPVEEPPLKAPAAKPADTKSPGKKRWLLPTAVLASLALVAGGVATAFVLTGDDKKNDTTSGAGKNAAEASAKKRQSILGEPGREWRVDVADLVDGPEPYLYDPLNDVGRGARAFVFDDTVVVNINDGAQRDENTFQHSFHLIGLDVSTGEVKWRKQPGASCSAGKDSAGHDAWIFCSTWSGEGEVSEVNILDPSTGDSVFADPLGHRVDGMFVEGDGDVLTFGPVVSSDSYDMVVSHGSIDDLDRDWTRVHSDVNQIDTHGIFPELTDQGALWAITGMGRLWMVDKETGESRTPALANATEFPMPLPGGGWIAGTTVHDADGTVLWEEPGAEWISMTDDGEHAILTWRDDDYVTLQTQVRELRTGTVLWTVDGDESVESTPHPGLVTVCCGDQMEVRDADTGRVLWGTKAGLMEADLDSPSAAPVWNTANGDFRMYEATSGQVGWERTGFELYDEGAQDTFATSRDDVLVVASTQSVRGFTDFATPRKGLGDAGEDGDSDGSTEYVTACGREPEFEPVTSTARDGGVSIEFVVKAVCPGGQWLSGSQVRLSVNAQDGGTGGSTDATRPLADGLFDFSDKPVWVPDDSAGTRVRSWFPIGRVWGTEREIQDAIDRNVVVVECIEEDVVDAPAPDPDEVPDDTSEVDSADPGTSTDERDDREENSLDALRRLADEDQQPALDEIAGQWVPQLSSKQDGTHDDHDAKTYTYTDIYEQHLELRLQYPSVRLLWSGDWGSFKESDYWVTVAGVTFDKPRGALRWCEREGFAPSQCYAKKVRVSGPAEGTTRHRKD